MAHALTALADGQVPNALGGIYTVPAGQRVYVHKVTLYNLDPLTQIVVVMVNRSGTARRWKRYEFAQNEHAEFPDGLALALEAGDMILASATSPNAVDFTVSGVIES